MGKPVLRCLIYSRISADRDDTRAGVERQEALCRKLAADLGWSVVGVLVDNDISAAGGKRRPAYEQLLADLAGGRADAVVAWHPDRMYRRLVELERLVDVVTAHRIEVRTVSAGTVDLSTPTGRAMARTAATWAGYEVEHGVERMRAAKREAGLAGKWRGGPRVFGYEANGLDLREDEAAEVRSAADRVLAGESLSSIAADWRTRGVVSPSGKTAWTATSIRRILARPRNAAIAEITADGMTAEAPALWAPIVPEGTWRGLRALFADPARNTGGTTRERVHIGSGLFRCGVCGDGTTVRIGGGRGATRYRCRAVDHLSRASDPVDEYVGDVIVGVLGRPDTRLRLHDAPEHEVAALQAEAVALREELEGLRRALGQRTIDLRTFQTASGIMSGDLAKVEGRLAESSARSPLAGFADAEDVRAAWDAATVGRRRAILAVLVEVTLMPARRGRQPDGGFFDSASVLVEPK